MSSIDAAGSSELRRVIVMGASNVTLGLPTIVECVRSGFEGPLRIEIADGHGRSYGKWTTVLPRSVPGHSICSVPPELDASIPTPAVLSDIRNDLVYGISVEQTSQWVRQVAERLADSDAEIVMTALPIASVQNLSRVRFNFFRRLLLPGSPLRFDGLVEKVEELNAAVRAIASELCCQFVELDAAWYDIDPIHFRRSSRRLAWCQILGGWSAWKATEHGAPPLVADRSQWTSKGPSQLFASSIAGTNESQCLYFSSRPVTTRKNRS